MSTQLHRNKSELHAGADEKLRAQLAIYKTPATMRELITVPFFVQIVAPRRGLFSKVGNFPTYTPLPPSTTNKRYKHFSEPAIGEFPYGFSNSDPASGDPLGVRNYLPFGHADGSDRKVRINKQRGFFAYENNVSNNANGAIGDYANAQVPVAGRNPPTGDANDTTIYPVTGANVGAPGDMPKPEEKFYPVLFPYNPPTPYPPWATWDLGNGEVDVYQTTTKTNVKQQIARSMQSDIFDLIGTEVTVDLKDQFNKLQNIQTSSDKIAWKITLESVAVDSDGRTLASARLIDCGLDAIKRLVANPWDAANDVTYTANGDTRLRQFMYENSGFGYPALFQPRPVIAQSINVAFPELRGGNDSPQFVATNNDGFSIDKSNGSLITFGQFPWTQLKMKFGHYTPEPIGNTASVAVENEIKSGGYYDLNNEWYSDILNGGSMDPPFKNQQISKISFRFIIEMVSLF